MDVTGSRMLDLRTDMDRERPEESPWRGICLPPMRSPEEAQFIGARQEPEMRPRGIAVRLGAALIAAALMAAWAIPYAFRHRGYSAIGGEWVLIIAAGAIVFLGCRPVRPLLSNGNQ